MISNIHRYGLPFVSPNNILVSTVNGTGAGIEIIYVLVFIIFSPKKERIKIVGLFTVVLSMFSTVVFVSLFALHGISRKLFCGFAAAIFSVIMYGSPLSIMVSQPLFHYHTIVTLLPILNKLFYIVIYFILGKITLSSQTMQFIL